MGGLPGWVGRLRALLPNAVCSTLPALLCPCCALPCSALAVLLRLLCSCPRLQVRKMEADVKNLKENPQTTLLEGLHSVAYSGGLGRPLIVPEGCLNGLTAGDTVLLGAAAIAVGGTCCSLLPAMCSLAFR